LPTIPSATAFETYKGVRLVEENATWYVTNKKGQVVDQFGFKKEVLKKSTYKRESTENLSIREMTDTLNIQNKNQAIVDFAPDIATFKGKTVTPEMFFAKAKPKPGELKEYKGVGENLFEVPKKQDPLSFKKTQVELDAEAKAFTSDKVFEPTKTVAERTTAFQDLGNPKDLQTDPLFSAIKREPLSFRNPAKSTEPKPASIPDLLSTVKAEQAKYRGKSQSIEKTLKELNDAWLPEKPTAPKADAVKQPKNELFEQPTTTQNNRNQPQSTAELIEQMTGNSQSNQYRETASELYLSQLREGTPIANTAKAPKAETSPFTWQGISFYSPQTAKGSKDALNRVTTEVYPTVSYAVYPKSQSKDESKRAIKSIGLMAASAGLVSKGQNARAESLSSIANSLRADEITRTDQKPRTITNQAAVETQKLFTGEIAKTRTDVIGGESYTQRNLNLPFSPFDTSQWEPRGWNEPPRRKRQGVKSIKFVNPILVGIELLGNKNSGEDTLW
jgi:hypothetical protein